MTESPPTDAATRPKRSLWRHPDFLKLWTAETISQFGTQITILALPLTAILVLKATPFEVGVLETFQFLPFVLVGLPAGVWVDRLRRRPVLIVGDLGRAVALGSIPIAYALGMLTLPHLYIAAFVTGVLTVFFDVAYQSYLPSLVETDQLVDGNSKLEVSRASAQVGGPGVGGGLIELVAAPVAILADSLSYLGSALFVLLIRRAEPPVEIPEGGHPKMRRQIVEGWRFVVGHPYLRWIAACTATSNLFGSMVQAVFLVYAVRVLGLSPGLIGVIFMAGGVGAIAGAFAAGRIGRILRLGWAIVAGIALANVAFLAVPLVTRGNAVPLLIGALALGGIGNVVYNVSQVSYRQAICPPRMQGRMNATMRFLVWGTLPVGAFVGGSLGTAIGLRPTLWVGAIGGMIAVLPALLTRVRTLDRIPEPEPFDEAVGLALASSAEGAIEPGQLPHQPAVEEPAGEPR